jgi:hypothetical protein
MFGENCRIVYGKRHTITNEIIPNSCCVFKHPFENIDEWMKRTNTTIPELPKTSKQSRLHLKNETQRVKQGVEQIHPTNNQTSVKVQHHPYKYINSYSDIIQNKTQQKEENKTQQNKVSIINVPNKELAQFALKSLFEIGIYNVKIVVE